MTSRGEMSAARITTPSGSREPLDEGAEVGDLRRDLTTSLTPRFSVLALVAITVMLAFCIVIAFQ